MKRLAVILFLTVTCFAASAQTKRALIIAIANYPPETGWPNISCDKDVELVKPAYTNQGFTDITLLTDSNASHDGFVNAMKLLTAKTQKGDIILVHYSGHGQQIFDDNGDEPDGLDEALVTWGAPSEYYEGYIGEKHLRDDEFGMLLDELRTKAGSTGNVIVVIDACHSGTASRGIAKKRGGKPALIPPGYSLKQNGKEINSGFFSSGFKSRGALVSLSPMITYSASSFDEENSETSDDAGNGVGSLSYAIAKALSKCNKDFTYRTLFASVLSIMNQKVPQQTPMIEGEMDLALFNGKYVKQQPYFTLKEITEKKIVLNAGTLTGVFENTKVAIYPSGTLNKENTTPVARGEIINAGSYQSVIKLEKEIPLKAAVDYWIFITEPSFKIFSVKYNIRDFDDKNLAAQITERLNASGVAMHDEKNPDIILNKDKDKLKIIRSSDSFVLDSLDAASSNSVDMIAAYIKIFSQNKYLIDLASGFTADLKLTLLPCDENGKLTERKDTNAFFEMRSGMHARIKVFNNSDQKIYYNIIDVQPDEQINPVIPLPNELTLKHAEQYVLEPNSEKELPAILTITPPYGKEVFKIFAANEPFNLTTYIVNNTSQSTRGISGSVQNAFKRQDLQTRGATIKKEERQTLYTNEFVFFIKP